MHRSHYELTQYALKMAGPCSNLFLNPDDCIDCSDCEPVCPVDAIFPDDEVPDNETKYIDEAKKYDYDSSEPGSNL